ncbi:MAG: hypothetical protein H6585_12685 [Flavobacteriales bacterium]|nr:hypothetical protein [Flavobacteriales bacterium]MCB9449187.1 hypothetical protein [Flavobacteriales bacterium]
MKWITICLGAMMLASCATKVPFTQQTRDEYKLTEEELKSLQFYTSHDIVLQRWENQGKEKATEDGTLKIRSGQSVEEVVIRAGTPGVVEKVVDGNRLAISFEAGDHKFLVFGDTKKQDGRYTLQATEWVDNRAKVNYNDQWYMTNTGSGSTYLVFKIKKLNQFRRKQQIAKGRKI